MVENKIGYEEARKILETEFAPAYMFMPPYADYIQGAGITSRGMVEQRKESEQGYSRTYDQVKDDLVRMGENPGEIYPWVGLKKELPPDLQLPDEFKGLKIYTEVTGEMILHKDE